MTEQSSLTTARDYAQETISRLETENEHIEIAIDNASFVTRKLGALGLGKLPQYIGQRMTNRIVVSELKDRFKIYPWDLPDLE